MRKQTRITMYVKTKVKHTCHIGRTWNKTRLSLIMRRKNMPLFLLPMLTAIAVTKTVSPILLGAGTIFAAEYARSTAKNCASKRSAEDIYNEEYNKRKAQKDAERDS